jgi:hypothetical protein
VDINEDRIIWLEQQLEGFEAAAEPKIKELLNEIREAAPLLSEAMAWSGAGSTKQRSSSGRVASFVLGSRGHCHRADPAGRRASSAEYAAGTPRRIESNRVHEALCVVQRLPQ